MIKQTSNYVRIKKMKLTTIIVYYQVKIPILLQNNVLYQFMTKSDHKYISWLLNIVAVYKVQYLGTFVDVGLCEIKAYMAVTEILW